MPKNESIAAVLVELAGKVIMTTHTEKHVSIAVIEHKKRIDTALADIKRILREEIKGMKYVYPFMHETTCSCGRCANTAYKNSVLDSVIEMVEEIT